MSQTSDALRNARKDLGWSQARLAEELGISPQFMWDIETGRRPLHRRYYPKLPPLIRRAVITAEIAVLRALLI